MSIGPLQREQVSAEFGFSVRQCGQIAMEASTIHACGLDRSNYLVWGPGLQPPHDRCEDISITGRRYKWTSELLRNNLIGLATMAFNTYVTFSLGADLFFLLSIAELASGIKV